MSCLMLLALCFFCFLTTDGWSSGYRAFEGGGGGAGCLGVCMTCFDCGFV